MTGLTNDEMADRIVRSLKDNSAALSDKGRSANDRAGRKPFARYLEIVVAVIGGAAGLLLIQRIF